MVYGYKTNKEFVDKTYQLLEKLDKKGIWNKDTLIIGLDKSVRPLAYTIRKLSSEEGRPTPDIKFFNYSSHLEVGKEELDKIIKYLRSKKNPITKTRLITQKTLSKYKSFLILDDHLYSGMSQKNTQKIIKNFIGNKNKDIYLVALGTTKYSEVENDEEFIFVDKDLPMGGESNKFGNLGIEDSYDGEVEISKRINSKDGNNQFFKDRNQLRYDIKKYIQRKHLKQKRLNWLEKIVSAFSFVFIFAGLVVGFSGMTGNVIGTSGAPNAVGIGLIAVGVLGLFFSKKFRRLN